MFASQITIALLKRVQVKDYEPFEARVEMTFHLEEKDDQLKCGHDAIQIVRDRLADCFIGKQKVVVAPVVGDLVAPSGAATHTPVATVPSASDLDL